MSSFAYQGFGRGLALDDVRRANDFATTGLRPDLTIVLDVDPQEGVTRRARAGAADDRIERAGAEFHLQVARAYRLLSETEAGVAVVPGSGEPEAVQERIREVLRDRFPETFVSAQG
jgi:dTMP kinase